MPEGDTIYRSARRLRQVMVGTVVEAASDNGRFFSSEALVGGRFEAVESRGKHLLMHLDDGRVVHSHMGMTGSWHVYAINEPWQKSPRGAGLALELCGELDRRAVVACFWPKSLELLSSNQFRRHPFLHRLGPDLLGPSVELDAVLARFRIHDATTIGEAVMNQTIVSGIGNVYKSETLFLTQTSPFDRVGELSDAEILRITQQAQQLMRQNHEGYPRRTRRRGDGQRLWVYGRRGELCFRCGSKLRMQRQGDLGRSTYWCPECQPSKASQ